MSLTEECVERYTKDISEIYAFFYKHLYKNTGKKFLPKCCDLCYPYCSAINYDIETFDTIFPKAHDAIHLLLKNFTIQFASKGLPKVFATTKEIYKYLLIRHHDCHILKKFLADTFYLFSALIIAHRTIGARISTEEYLVRLGIKTSVHDMNRIIYQTMLLCDMLLI
jgi:hypothetical protein